MDPHNLQFLSNYLPDLVNELKTYSLYDTVAKLSSLLVRQKYHPNTLRLETLIHLAVLHCEGKYHPKPKDLARWLNEYLGDEFALFEDPVEDVFVSNICLKDGNARLFEGGWESSDFYTQQLLDISNSLPESRETQVYWDSIKAILRLSESIAERVKVERNTISTGNPKSDIALPSEKQLQWQKSWVIFEKNDLSKLGIHLTDLAPFILDFQKRHQIDIQSIGFTNFERYPLLIVKNSLIVALPTAISLAIRRFILEWFSDRTLLSSLNENLSKWEVGQVFCEALPRLEAKPYSPDKSQEPQPGYWYSDIATFDIGKYAHILVISDTLNAEPDFTNLREPSDDFTRALENEIFETSQKYSEKSNFTGGLSILITGGIGQGTVMRFKKVPTANHWHFISMNIADFILLSWDTHISLLKMWKIEEQKQYLEENKIDFSNINGFLNLYGYWKKTNNSLCPDEYPFMSSSGMLGLMTDFLTKIREDLRVGYDEHSVSFGNGVFYRVKRESDEPFFQESKMLPAYVSFKLLRTKGLYGVIEANRPWWIVLNQYDIPLQHKFLTNKIWEAVFRWMTKAAALIDQSLENKSNLPIKILIDLKSIAKWPEFNPNSLSNRLYNDVTFSVKDDTITIHIEKEFISNFFQPINYGEKCLIRAIALGVQELEGKSLELEK